MNWYGDLYIVQQPSRFLAETQETEQNTQKTQKTQNKNKQKKHEEESDRRSSSVTLDEKEVIALYQLNYWYGKTRQHRKQRHKNHIAIPLCE